jgi:hypothetical protein
MTAAILSALAPLWREIAGALAALAVAAGLYLKGRRDKAQADRLKDMTDANRIRKDGADARRAADARDSGDGLRRDDGWRRD